MAEVAETEEGEEAGAWRPLHCFFFILTSEMIITSDNLILLCDNKNYITQQITSLNKLINEYIIGLLKKQVDKNLKI